MQVTPFSAPPTRFSFIREPPNDQGIELTASSPRQYDN